MALGGPGGFRTLILNTLATAAIAFAVALALNVIRERAQTATRSSEPAGPDTPLIEQRIARSRSLLAASRPGGVVLVALLALLEVWGLDVVRWLGSDAGGRVLPQLVTIALVLVFTRIVREAIDLAIERSATRAGCGGPAAPRRSDAHSAQPHPAFRAGIPRNNRAVPHSRRDRGQYPPLLAGAGVIGLAIGFGSQRPAQDIITGTFVLFSDTLHVGDVVEVTGRSGVVEGVAVRTIVLRDYGGNVHTIPYSAIHTVTNLTKDFSYAVFEIGVSYRESVDELMQVLHDLGAEMPPTPTSAG